MVYINMPVIPVKAKVVGAIFLQDGMLYATTVRALAAKLAATVAEMVSGSAHNAMLQVR